MVIISGFIKCNPFLNESLNFALIEPRLYLTTKNRGHKPPQPQSTDW